MSDTAKPRPLFISRIEMDYAVMIDTQTHTISVLNGGEMHYFCHLCGERKGGPDVFCCPVGGWSVERLDPASIVCSSTAGPDDGEPPKGAA